MILTLFMSLAVTFQLIEDQDLYSLDKTLRDYEKQLHVLPEVVQKGYEVGEKYLKEFIAPELTSVDHALELRYLHVPLLYKLGMAKEASSLAQATFKYLYPALHEAVETKLCQLFGSDYRLKLTAQAESYSIDSDLILKSSSRVKSCYSVWRKIPSLEFFEQMNRFQFALAVDDFIGVRWEMVLQQGENRFDALINGLRIAPKKHLVHYRNQYLTQASGFDNEPVMKLCYIEDNFPVELQLLGGPLTAYLSAKGYAAYKTGCKFFPSKSDLSEGFWKKRLQMAATLGESFEFRQNMLKELLGELPDYSIYPPFENDKAPLLEMNRSYVLQGPPAYTQKEL